MTGNCRMAKVAATHHQAQKKRIRAMVALLQLRQHDMGRKTQGRWKKGRQWHLSWTHPRHTGGLNFTGPS
jgi:hypothetical protein